jgi:hypothetical protein
MEYYSLLLFGGLVGMQHALEADHLAAMAALSTGQTSRRSLVLRGSLWGLGHTLTLLSICGALLIWGGTISVKMQAFLQIIVGVMIMSLGANVIYTLWKKRPHLHFHQHESGLHHLHAHTHVSESLPHTISNHPHKHHDLGLRRVVMVGMVHGVAGSAGLLVLAASASSVPVALGYILAFGIGSIIGMGTLSFIVSYPIGFIERSATWMNTSAMAAIGCAAMFIGLHLLTENWLML